MPKTSAASTSTGDALAPEEMRRTCGVDSSLTSVRSSCYIECGPGAKTLGTLYAACSGLKSCGILHSTSKS